MPEKRGLRPGERLSLGVPLLMGAKRKFSDQNAPMMENPSGGCPPASAHSELVNE